MISPTYDPILGGAEYVIKSLTDKLNEQDIQTDVMAFNMDKIWYPKWKNQIVYKDNSKIYRIKAFNLFQSTSFNPTRFLFNVNIFTDLSFRKIFREYDILHFHNDIDLSFPLYSGKRISPSYSIAIHWMVISLFIKTDYYGKDCSKCPQTIFWDAANLQLKC